MVPGQRPHPTAVVLLGFWLLFGCDNFLHFFNENVLLISLPHQIILILLQELVELFQRISVSQVGRGKHMKIELTCHLTRDCENKDIRFIHITPAVLTLKSLTIRGRPPAITKLNFFSDIANSNGLELQSLLLDRYTLLTANPDAVGEAICKLRSVCFHKTSMYEDLLERVLHKIGHNDDMRLVTLRLSHIDLSYVSCDTFATAVCRIHTVDLCS